MSKKNIITLIIVLIFLFTIIFLLNYKASDQKINKSKINGGNTTNLNNNGGESNIEDSINNGNIAENTGGSVKGRTRIKNLGHSGATSNAKPEIHNLDEIINNFNKNYSTISEKIKSNLLSKREDNYYGYDIDLFLYICRNNNEIERYFKLVLASDSSLTNFLKKESNCRYSLLDGIFKKSINNDSVLKDYLKNKCGLNDAAFDNFDQDARPFYIIMGSYYLGQDDKNNTKKYLQMFSSVSDQDQEKYYGFMHRNYSQLFLDIIDGNIINQNQCSNYLLKDTTIINKYLETSIKKVFIAK